ncbi:MAG: PH domain-containing protein [Anaerolineales bacterium]
MSIEQIRAKVIGSIWQAVAQSGVDLSALPHDQQENLVSKIADNVMATINSLQEDEIKEEVNAEIVDNLDENVLWKGRPFLSLVESYLVTTERIKIVRGLLSRDVENFELIRIQDLDYKQGINERIFGIGDIMIRGHDASDPEILLRNVGDPEDVYEILRKAWLDARKRHGLEFREFM